MFIATRAARSAKLRRSGMYSRSLGHCRRSLGAKIPIHAAPTELGRASEVVVTINMALLTELDPSPPPKMRIRSSSEAAPPSEFRQDAASRWPHSSTDSFLIVFLLSFKCYVSLRRFKRKSCG